MLMDDIKYGTLPQVSFVIPGLISSGATSDPETADAELKSILDPVLTNEANLQDTTIIISTINTKDAAQPPAFTLFVGNGVKDEQITIDTSANHYNLLRTIELGLQLGHLNQNDAKADPILGFWK